jgi:uncharacterized membrane protein
MESDGLIAQYHLHPIVDHFTIALVAAGVIADLFGCLFIKLAGQQFGRLLAVGKQLRGAAVLLLLPGALSAILSRLTGESEAERIWDSLSLAAQTILFSDSSYAHILSHAVLGSYLMYAFIMLAGWQLLIEIWPRLQSTQFVYLAAALISLWALLYQGTTGRELVYDHGAGTRPAAASRYQSSIATSMPQEPETETQPAATSHY